MRKIILLIITCSIYSYADGGVPMLTDGSGTPGNGNWEINLGYTGNVRPHFSRYEKPTIDINYGLGESIQLKVEGTYIGLQTQEQDIEGLGNIEVGIKWRFYDKNDLAISIYPQFGFSPIQSHINNGLADYDKMYLLPIEITKKFGHFWVTGEGGYIWMSKAENQMKYGLIGGYDITEKCTLMTEIYDNSNVDGTQKTVIANFGLTYDLISNITMLLSAGRELITPEAQRATLFYTGIQFKF